MLKYLKMFQQGIHLNLTRKFFLFFLSYIICITNLYALPETKQNDQIEIESDHAEYDDKKGVAHYMGNVKAMQNTKDLNSDELHMHNRGEGFDLFIAKSHNKRAVLTNKNEKSMAIAIGKANTIIYDTKLDKMDFIGNAELTQDGYTVTGEFLTYFFKEQRLISPQRDQQRTKVVLPAESMKG